MKTIRKIITLGILAVSSFLIAMAGIYFYAKIQDKPVISKASGVFYYDSNGNPVESESLTNDWAPLETISPYLIKATISIEDKNFYSHNGFDYPRIVKAVLVNIKNRSKSQGASTITQQYARNLYLTLDKTWSRKLNEAWYAVLLESHYSKDDILEGYLNTIPYGHGAYGIENAANFYFNKSSSDLTLAEAAMLAGIPNRPAATPLVREEYAKNRQYLVLKLMVRNKYITQKQMDDALKEKLTYYGKKDPLDLQTLSYYEDAVMKELKTIKEIPKTLLETGGIKIFTTLNLSYQKTLEQKVKDNLGNQPDLQVASILMDPKTGAVVALTGGYDYKKSQFNRAIDAKRQVGSTMKALLYYRALELGYTSSSTFESVKTSFTFQNSPTLYEPSNFGDKYANADISLAEAIAVSDNVFAVKTHLYIGTDKLVAMAQRLGIKSKMDPVPSLPLGTEEMKLMEITNAYAHFANGGKKVEPYFINKVVDMNGKVIYQRTVPKEEQILDPSITFILNELLTGMFDLRLNSYTNVSGISVLPYKTHTYAGKSGSTDTDSLMIGYTPELLMSVWVGYDELRKIEDTSEYQISKRIWIQTLEDIFRNKDTGWYKVPDNVNGVLVNPITGEPATKGTKSLKILYYLKGTEPTLDIANEFLDNVDNYR